MSQKVFHERVLPSAGFFVMFLLLPIAIWLVFLPLNQELGIALAFVAYAAVVVAASFGAPVIEVESGELRVAKANLPMKDIGEIVQISAKDTFDARGSELDARAFTKFQFGVKNLLRIENVDELDPTPYWLVATRNPAALKVVLESQRP